MEKRVEVLEDLVCEAAPLTWVMTYDGNSAREWESKVADSLLIKRRLSEETKED